MLPQNRIAKSPVYATTIIRHYDVLRENTLKQVIFVRVRQGAIDRTCQKLDVSKIGALKNTLVDRTLILTQ